MADVIDADEAAASPERGTRGIELKFSKPLERFQTVKVEFLEGIVALGGDALRPWTLTFTTGR